MRFDPAVRRRVRRAGARARPWLLPVALVVTGLLLAPSGNPQAPPAAPAPASAAVPDGLVLVAVRPADPSVLSLVGAGSRVDVYAASGAGSLDLTGAPPAPADLVVSGARVAGAPQGAGRPAPDPAAEPGAEGVLGLGGAPSATAVPLLVTDAEAAALAARPGGPFLLAVRGTGRPGGRDDR